MAGYEMIIKDVNKSGGAVYKDGESVILRMYLNYIPRQHDIFKFNDEYYEVIRIISDIDDVCSPLTIVVRKYVMSPEIIDDVYE